MTRTDLFDAAIDPPGRSGKARVVRATLNLGDLPYFASGSDVTTEVGAGQRQICFHRDRPVARFPLLFCESRMVDALEMNLFMEHRYRGRFLPPKKGGNRNPCGGVTVKTLVSLANSLRGFLGWLADNDVDWHEVYAVSDGEKARAWLPPYRYRAYLIGRVVAGELSRDTANLYINHVRQFYEWALSTRRIERIPFRYTRMPVRKSRRDGDVDLLFHSTYGEKALMVQTSDLAIPKKYRGRQATSGAGLKPFSTEEIRWFFDSHYMRLEMRRLWGALALTCGLRADEVATLPEGVAEDPSLAEREIFSATVVGKFNKARRILIPRFLMHLLWQYRNSPERLHRAVRWDLVNGPTADRPLFLNRSGARVNSGSVSNITACVASELAASGIAFNRSFHDLRSTFATSLARFMLDRHIPLGFIEYWLMALLGHSQFSTTLKYINFARSVTFEQQMQDWVDQVFADLVPWLQGEAVPGASPVGDHG
ncbi:site-specific integrase [Burkholderia ubonensis]|uniref:tyrosine-type recombinase/integrase n=1 Tax=Burkholderia ubonensis TaxID=101571 RepID=UPI0009B3F1D3